MALLCLIITHCCMAQRYYFPQVTVTDSVSLSKQMTVLAREILLNYQSQDHQLFQLQLLAGKYQEAFTTITALRSRDTTNNPPFLLDEYYGKAKLEQPSYTRLFRNLLNTLDDKTAYHRYNDFILEDDPDELKDDFRGKLSAIQKDSLTASDAIALCSSYYLMQRYLQTAAISRALVQEDCKRRYTITNTLIKTQDGALIHAVVVLKKAVFAPQPAVLQYTIYADSNDIRIVEPTAYGYAGIMAYTRGKGLSPDEIIPYEKDGKDADAVISWISRQSWCNGKVGMYGGSYNGFTQWAAAKYRNPALKTIVPYVAAIPGLGLPMENNVFINANYGWAFYVTGNRYLDNKTYYDPQRWRALNNNWYESGRAYRRIDSIDGTPNPWLQRWLQHPDYDAYWQDQVPYQKDFAGINIPVLTVEGYYDDGQISGLHYLTEHLKYNPQATHYLVIGPYDHFGTQSGGVPVLRDYEVDPVALINTRDLTFQWLDYILKGAPKPARLKDRINYEVMGANTWKHAPSIAKMANKTLRLYLTDTKEQADYLLSLEQPAKKGALAQTIDLADRSTYYGDYYPFPIIKNELNRSNSLFFISKPFTRPMSVNGMFSGMLKATINKKDMDVTVTLYEVTPEGKYFELSYFLGRASYAKDMSKRTLLHPGVETSIPFTRTRLVSRQLSKGSRLLVVLNIDKNNFAQVNFGTGKDVSDENIQDGAVPLNVKWSTGSYIEVPVMQ